ncbi:MAG: hypothetical protein ABSE55_16705 [Terracidiphilus sp.]|jgi:hypothetical protein
MSLLGLGGRAPAQDTPLLSGGVAFVTNTTGGNATYIPLIQPLAVVPLGNHFLVESRAGLLELFTPTSSGYEHSHFTALTYLQGDYIASPHLTVVGGSFLLPFGTYNERLTPVWIGNFQDESLAEPIGQMGTGVGLGGQVRGSLLSSARSSFSYAAWFSARSDNLQFNSERSSGGRAIAYFPGQRLELGASYGRLLQESHENFVGMHLWWQTKDAGFRVRSEAMRGEHAYGYWFEADYRPICEGGGPVSFVRRFEPLLRMQQTFRIDNAASDGVPAQNTQRVDFGLDCNLPHNARILSSYSRQFSSAGDVNIWETGIVYRFLLPAWKGR